MNSTRILVYIHAAAERRGGAEESDDRGGGGDNARREVYAEAVRTAVYLQNWASANGGVSPHELYFGKKLTLGHLRVFGSIA